MSVLDCVQYDVNYNQVRSVISCYRNDSNRHHLDYPADSVRHHCLRPTTYLPSDCIIKYSHSIASVCFVVVR